MGSHIRPLASDYDPLQAGDSAPQRSADLLDRDVDNRHIELNDYLENLHEDEVRPCLRLYLCR